MKIVIGNKPIELLPKEIKVAKALYTKFLQEVKTNSVDNGVPSLYFTTIIMSYVMSQDLLKALTPEALSVIMNAASVSKLADNSEQNKTNPVSPQATPISGKMPVK